MLNNMAKNWKKHQRRQKSLYSKVANPYKKISRRLIKILLKNLKLWKIKSKLIRNCIIKLISRKLSRKNKSQKQKKSNKSKKNKYLLLRLKKANLKKASWSNNQPILNHSGCLIQFLQLPVMCSKKVHNLFKILVFRMRIVFCLKLVIGKLVLYFLEACLHMD